DRVRRPPGTASEVQFLSKACMPSAWPGRSAEQKEAAVLAHHAGGTGARTLYGTRCPRGAPVGAVELPPELLILLPGHERATVRGTQGDDAGPHAGPSRRLDFGRLQRLAFAVQAGEVDFPLGGPGRNEAASLARDRVVRHGAAVDLPRGAAD